MAETASLALRTNSAFSPGRCTPSLPRSHLVPMMPKLSTCHVRSRAFVPEKASSRIQAWAKASTFSARSFSRTSHPGSSRSTSEERGWESKAASLEHAAEDIAATTGAFQNSREENAQAILAISRGSNCSICGMARSEIASRKGVCRTFREAKAHAKPASSRGPKAEARRTAVAARAFSKGSCIIDSFANAQAMFDRFCGSKWSIV
mmetsp:Transcript_40967/g.95656  ORF Transcript_40967/g.95656 Transcript_40967/m.95656 type:complete len:206 (+) Transcript_40967:465-1082(+)